MKRRGDAKANKENGMRKLEAFLQAWRRKMKRSSRTQAGDPNRYRQTDIQLSWSVHSCFVHLLTFFLRYILFFLVSKMLKYTALSKKKSRPVSCLYPFHRLPLQSDALCLNHPGAFLPVMKLNEQPY